MARRVLLLSVVLLTAAAPQATAQTPMPGTLVDGVPVADIPGDGTGVARGEGGATVGSQRGARRRPALVRSCRTKRSTRTRVCHYRRDGILVKTCTRRRGARAFRCRYSRARAAEAMPRARLSALQRQGWQHPALPAVGRIYLDGRGHCTGTLITRGVVVTASHCVYAAAHEGLGGTDTYIDRSRLTFVPGNEHDGTTRYGRWAVAATYATQAYALGDKGADWGFLVLAPDASGRYAGDYVPGTFATRALVSGITHQTRISRMGYPSEGGWATPQYYGGNGQYFCVGSFDTVRQDGALHYWLDFGGSSSTPFCPMNGGSSGGPNFIQLTDGTWAIVAVNNRAVRGEKPMLWGRTASNTWFDQQFLAFYDAVFAAIGGRSARAASAGGAIARR